MAGFLAIRSSWLWPMTEAVPMAQCKAFTALIFQQKVNVVIAPETSAARNAGLPVVARGKVPFIYASYYEGHSCAPNLFVDAWVPDQQVAPIVDYFFKEKGAKSFFLIGRLCVRPRHARFHARLYPDAWRHCPGGGIPAHGCD